MPDDAREPLTLKHYRVPFGYTMLEEAECLKCGGRVVPFFTWTGVRLLRSFYRIRGGHSILPGHLEDTRGLGAAGVGAAQSDAPVSMGPLSQRHHVDRPLRVRAGTPLCHLGQERAHVLLRQQVGMTA